MNSPPLSLCRRIGAPCFESQHSKNFFMNSDDFFDFMMLPALKRVNSSITCKYHSSGFHSCKSTVTVSLKYVASGSPMAGFGTGRLHWMHVSQTILNIHVSSDSLSVLPALLSTWASLSYVACPNCVVWLQSFSFQLCSCFLELRKFSLHSTGDYSV